MIWNCEAPIMIECGVCHCLMLKQSIYLSQSASVASLDWSAILQGLTLPSTVFHITRYLKTIYWRYQRFEPRVSCTRSIYCPTGLRSFPKGWTVPLQFADVTFHGCTIVPTLEMIMILAHSGTACLLGQSAWLFPWRANFPTWKVTPWEKQHVLDLSYTYSAAWGDSTLQGSVCEWRYHMSRVNWKSLSKPICILPPKELPTAWQSCMGSSPFHRIILLKGLILQASAHSIQCLPRVSNSNIVRRSACAGEN